jgi:ferritin-like metal-binding protein YciE
MLLGAGVAGLVMRRAASRTDTPDALVDVCVQDLYAGKLLLARRLPRIARAAGDPALRALLDEAAGAAARHAWRLAATGVATGGPRNIWMTGILDDAARDTRSVAAGRLLDVALIGAVRKALAAQIVSDDTAIALADACGRREVSMTVRAIQEEERASDATLRARLAIRAGS